MYNVQCTHCTNQLLETSSAVLCTHNEEVDHQDAAEVMDIDEDATVYEENQGEGLNENVI